MHKTFSDFVSEATDYEVENAKKSKMGELSIGGWRVHAVTHAHSQSVERHPEKTESDWKKLHSKALAHVFTTKHPKNGEHLFFSKSLNHGYVADVNYHKKTIRVVTALGDGKHEVSKNRPDTIKVMMEGVEREFVYVELD